MNLPTVCTAVGVSVCDSIDSDVYLMVSVCRFVLLSLAGYGWGLWGVRRWELGGWWSAQGRLCAEDKGDSSLFKRACVC